MMKARRQPWLVFGLVALVAFLGSLVVVFVNERRAQEELVAQQRRALEAYAQSALGQELREAFRHGLEQLQRVMADPLEPSAGLWWTDESGEVVLPRGVGRPGHADAKPLVDALRAQTLALTDDPRSERFKLVLELINANKPDTLQQTVRAFLEHRQHYVLAPVDDLTSTLVVAQQLVHQGVRRELLSGLVRDGLGPQQEGLQRALLRQWNRLAHEDATYLCSQISEVSRQLGLEVAAFEHRCQPDEEGTDFKLPDVPRGSELLVCGGRCVVARASAVGVQGVEVEPDALRLRVQQAMTATGLLLADDALSLPRTNGVALDSLQVAVTAPRLVERERALARSFALKLALVLLALSLGVGVIALASLEQARRERFIALKSDFVSSMSHELRTPLTGLRVMAETLERRLQGSEAARDYPARMVQQLDALTFLVENVLSFDRVEQGRWKLNRATWKVDAAVTRSSEDVPSLQVSTVGLEGLSVSADGELLHLVLINLFRNAAAYCVKVPAMEVRGQLAEGRLVLRFVDNGVGVPTAEWNRIFEPFERGSSSEGRRGSGLGLALCRRIVELHGGQLFIETSSQDGSTFVLSLPGSTAPGA